MPRLKRSIRKTLKERAKGIGIYKKLRTVKETIYDENDKPRKITKMVFSTVHGEEIPETEEVYVGIDYHNQMLLRIYSKHGWEGVEAYEAECAKEMLDFAKRHKLNEMDEKQLKNFVLNELTK